MENLKKKEPTLTLVPINKLYPHPLNPNELNETALKKLKQNISKTGQYPSLIVRKFKDGYQIIDGYHRYVVLGELGYKEAKCEVWDVSDKQAKILLATLNRLRGTDDTHKRATLFGEIAAESTDFDFVDLLPDSPRAINALLASLKDDDFSLEQERGMIEEKLLNAGVDSEQATQMADLYKPPSGKMVLTLYFNDDKDYRKVVQCIGSRPDIKKLIQVIDVYEHSNASKNKKKI